MRVFELVGANALLFCGGLGALPLLGVANSWLELFRRGGLGYFVGLALAGILSAHLALVGVGFGWLGLTLFAALLALAGSRRLRRTERPRFRRPSLVRILGPAALLAVIANYARAFMVAPLDRYDAWAIWGLKGHALYAFGWADPAVFAGAGYRFAHLEYPLLIPSLEAIDFRVMHAFDTRLVHLQFLLLLMGVIAGLWGLLQDRVPALLLWASLLAIALAPEVFVQLLSGYADLPLALFFALGAAAAGRWLVTNERWALALATLLFGAALLTKNEGTLFVAAAFLGLLVVAARRYKALAIAALADVAIVIPWRAYAAVYGLHSRDYRLTNSFDPDHLRGRLGIGPIAFRRLGEQMINPSGWGLLLPLAAIAVALALVSGLRSLPLYAIVVAVISWLGLSWIYVISDLPHGSYLASTEDRVIASIVLSLAAITPLLVAETLRKRSQADVDSPAVGEV